MLNFLLTRRSVKAAQMRAPGPSPEELKQILTAAVRVPDHKKLTPWRFILFEGDARAQFGDVLAHACMSEEAMQPSSVRLQTERERFLRAPLVVALISAPVSKPGVPEMEQILSCGAVGQNLCLAANALGYGTNWLTEWLAQSSAVVQALGLGEHERVAGFIYIGTPAARQDDRDRPDLARIVTPWQPQS